MDPGTQRDAVFETRLNEPAFSLLGGPLHRLGLRTGLVRNETDTLRLGLAIGLALWTSLMAIAAVDGPDWFSMEALGAHARLLLAIPLLFLAESMLDPRVSDLMRSLSRAQVIGPESKLAVGRVQARLQRLVDSAWPEWVFAAVAIAAVWAAPAIANAGSVSYGKSLSDPTLTAAGWWYSAVCLTVVRFLLLRWCFRLLLWIGCLWFLSRLKLRLLPSHPDGAAGLGNLEVVQAHFGALVLAMSVITASSLATDLHDGRMVLADVIPVLTVFLLVVGLLFVAPLVLFGPQLWACRVKGLSAYMELAEDYVRTFEAKWLASDPVSQSRSRETLLGTADLQSLADLGSSVAVVREMRIVPVTLRLPSQLTAASLLPMLPLLLFEYPFQMLLRQLLERLTGF